MKFSKFLEDYIEEDARLNTSRLCFFHEERLIGFYEYNENNTEMHQALTSYDTDKVSKYILGAAEYRENGNEDCLEIKTIHARKGYGPLIYLTLMEMSKGKGLCPTRIRGQVTKEAEAVWEKFLNPPNEPLAEPLDDLKNRVHENPALNKKYINIFKPNLSKAKANHVKALGKDPYGEKLTALFEAMDSFIREEMDFIYNVSKSS